VLLPPGPFQFSMIPTLLQVWLPHYHREQVALPYLDLLSQHNLPSTLVHILFIILVTASSSSQSLGRISSSYPIWPFRFSRPDAYGQQRLYTDSVPLNRWSSDYRRSTATMSLSSNSGGFWLTNEDAVD